MLANTFPDQSQTYLIEDAPNGKFRSTPFNGPVQKHILVFSNATRPAANTIPMGAYGWNTDDHAPNYSGGHSNIWYDAMGFAT